MNDLLEKKYVYDLILCKTNREPICFIPYSDLSFTGNYHNYNSISFTIEKYIADGNGKKINMAWKLLKQSLLVKLYKREYTPVNTFNDQIVYQEFFYLNTPTYNSDNQSLNVTADSWHKVHFENIKIRGYEQTRKLYDYTISADSSGDPIYNPVKYDPNDILTGGILNYIQEYKLPNWTIEYDYDYLSNSYSDNDKISINTVKQTIDDYLGGEGESFNSNAPYFQWYDKWLPWMLQLGSLFGYTVAGEQIEYNQNSAKIDNTSLNGYIKNLLQVYLFLNGNTILTSDEVSSSLANNELINTEFGRDWLTSNSMATGSSDEYNISILQNIYSLMFGKILNQFKTVIEILTNADFNLSQTYQYDDEICSINLTPNETDEVTMEDFYRVSFECYKKTAEVYMAITNLTVDTRERIRNLSFDNTDLASVFTQLEESYLCFFEFDNVNYIIKVYSRENPILNQSTNLIISPYNYMTGYSYSPNLDKIVTRLYFTGKDNLSFAGVNPTGQRFIDDFTPFTNGDIYMSKELREFIDYYNSFLNSYINTIYTTSVNTNTQTKNISSILNDYINTIYNKVAVAISYFVSFYYFINVSDTDDSYLDDEQYMYKTKVFKEYALNEFKSVYTYSKKCFSELSTYRLPDKPTTPILSINLDSIEHTIFNMSFDSYINELEDNISFNNVSNFIKIINFFGIDIDNNSPELDRLINSGSYSVYDSASNTIIPILTKCKKDISSQFQYENAIDSYFSSLSSSEREKIKAELNDFIFEDDINVEYIDSEDVGLYYAQKYIKYINTIPYSITVDMIDILSNSNFQRDWSNICNLGAITVIQSPDTEEYQNVRLLSYTHNPVSNSLSLTFGNKEELANSLNSLTQDVWQYSMRVAEKSQDYINKYSTAIESAIENLGIQTPDDNYDFGGANIPSSSNKNIYGVESQAATKSLINGLKNNNENVVPPNTINNLASGGYQLGKNISISKTEGNAIKNYPDGLYVDTYDGVEKAIFNTDTMQSLWCFSRYMLVQFLETNFDAIDLNKPYQAKRKYIRIFDDNIKVIEADLSETETEPYKDPEGNQLYWTSITGSDAYKFFTYSSPLLIDSSEKPNQVNDNTLVEQYTVKVRKTISEYVKCSLGFPVNESGTGEPELVFGTGDENGNGQYYFIKDNESGRFVYKSRTDGKEYGIANKDDGVYQITAGVYTKMYPMGVFPDLTQAEQMPTSSIIYIGAIGGGN